MLEIPQFPCKAIIVRIKIVYERVHTKFEGKKSWNIFFSGMMVLEWREREYEDVDREVQGSMVSKQE